MALLTCPECGKEISDQAKACPHCGYPIHTQEDPSPGEPSEAALVPTQPSQEDVPLQDAQPSEEPAEPPKKKKKKGKIVAAVLAALLVAGGLAGVSVHQIQLKAEEERLRLAEEQQKADYIENVSEVVSKIDLELLQAHLLCQITSAVWHDAVFNKYSNPSTSPYVVGGNINLSIQKLYDDPFTAGTVEKIKKSQNEIAEKMKNLQNPPEEYRDLYESINDYYIEYQALSNLAITPSGNLTQFNDNIEKHYNDAQVLFSKISIQLPEPIQGNSSDSSSI